ncbi:MAG TPA: hypothetical protein VM871_10375 [Flavisolibacter sp.]|jgi:hypothetical protein|nr:hypothetical protein [Flavisolibacter sp.]
MARLMSVYIEFNRETYLALVSVRQKETEFVCQVRYVDGGLHYQLSDELLVFDLNGVIRQPDCLKNAGGGSLLSNTIQAIRKQLQPG